MTDERLKRIRWCACGQPWLALHNADTQCLNCALRPAFLRAQAQLVEAEKALTRVKAELTAAEQSSAMACQYPADDCECPGCEEATRFHKAEDGKTS